MVGVGAGLTSGPNLAADNTVAFIASMRLSSGVLTAAQISNNYAAGLLAVVPITVDPPSASPTNILLVGDSATLSAVFTTNSSLTYTYQWQTDNGTAGLTWTAIPNATNATLVVNSTGFAPGIYEYEVVLSNNVDSIVVVSSPILVIVQARTAPILQQDITPPSVTAYVTQTNSFTVAFTGEPVLTEQWQVSSDNTNWTDTGVFGSNIVVTSEVPVTNWYRLTANNPLGTNVSSSAEFIANAALPLPPYLPVQTAGDLIVNLQQTDLSATSDFWTNVTSSTNGVGNFSGLLIGGSNLNVTAGAPYLYNRVPALLVNQQLTNGLQSALLAPTEICTNNPVSAEAWVYALAINEQNSCAVAYGIQGGSGDPEADREFNYCNQGSGATSGDFGSFDTRWGSLPTTGLWHYLAWTWDGTTLTCYEDGTNSVTSTPSTPLATPPTVVCVGGGLANSGPNLSADAFQGFIGAARLESGVLAASQIANNYTAGLKGTVPAVVWTPSVTPAVPDNIVYQGNTVTLGLVDRETTTFTYQWVTDNGSGGVTWANAAGASSGNSYALNVSSLAVGTYEYEIVLTNTTYALSITSAPVTLIVRAASPPTVLQQPTPASTNAYVGQTVTFTALFTGSLPLTNQWQFSTDGTTYNPVPGGTNATLTLTNVQLTNTASYRLTASNAQGLGSPTSAATLTVTAPPSVGFSFSGGALNLSWGAGGTLLEATSITGPWTVVTTTSPYVVTPATAGPALFFRVNYGP